MEMTYIRIAVIGLNMWDSCWHGSLPQNCGIKFKAFSLDE